MAVFIWTRFRLIVTKFYTGFPLTGRIYPTEPIGIPRARPPRVRRVQVRDHRRDALIRHAGKGSQSHSSRLVSREIVLHHVTERLQCPFPVPPRLAPAISGIDSFYEPGDLVEITCTSRDSKPAPTLTWTINDKHVGKIEMLFWAKRL